LRQYFPKKMGLMNISEFEVVKAVRKLNNRPKKCLNYSTPREVFEGHTGINLLECGVMQ